MTPGHVLVGWRCWCGRENRVEVDARGEVTQRRLRCVCGTEHVAYVPAVFLVDEDEDES